MANLRGLTLISSVSSSDVEFRGYRAGVAYGPFVVTVTNTAQTLTQLLEDAVPFDQLVIASIDTGTISYNYSGGSESPATYPVGTLSVGGVVSPPFEFEPTTLVSSLGELVAALANGGNIQLTQSITATSTLRIKSNTRLIIPPGVTLTRGNSVNHYLLRNAGSSSSYSDWDDGNENIYIGGGGSIDLNSANNNTTVAGIDADISNYPGFGIHFYKANRVTVEDLYIVGRPYTESPTNGGKYLIATTECTNHRYERLKLNNVSDGIHVLGKCHMFDIEDIEGTTTDDMIVCTPDDYSSYVIAGTAGSCSGINIRNVRQTGHKTAVKLLGETTSRILSARLENIYAAPQTALFPAVYLGAVVGCVVDGVYGLMDSGTPLIDINHDVGVGTVGITSDVTLRNLTRRELNAASGKAGRLVRVDPAAKVTSLVIDGFRCFQSDGTEGYVGSTSGTIDLDSQTASGGYLTHCVVQNGRCIDANSGNGRFISTNTGVGHNGSAFVGGVTVTGNYVEGVTYGIITTGSANAARWFIANNHFNNVGRPAQWTGAQNVQWGRNTFAGSTSRINEITVNTAVVHMDAQVVASSSCQPYYSSGSPFTYALAAGSSWQGIGMVTSISGTSTIGAFEADVIVCTGTTYTVTLRDGFPGQRKTIRNNASGDITVASTSSGTITGSPVAAGTTQTFVCTNHRDWTVV